MSDPYGLADFTRAQLADVTEALRAGDRTRIRHALTALGAEGDQAVVEHLYRTLATDDDVARDDVAGDTGGVQS